MKKSIVMMVALASSMFAADFSGIWNGKGAIASGSNKYVNVPMTAQMTLLQAGTSLKGTLKVGNAKAKVTPITSGTAAAQITLVAGGSTGTFTPNAAGNQLTGTITSSNGHVATFVFTKQ
jgi:hypothetical protein